MTNFDVKNFISKLSEQIGLNYVLTELLYKRGLKDASSIKEFLEPQLSNLYNAWDLFGMNDAVALIKKHGKDGRILIFGDYDCDGIGAVATLYLSLIEHDIESTIFIPTRIEDGYGLSESSLLRAIESSKPTLIITVDCGIGSVEEVELAKRMGVDIIITDHHEPREVLPNCIIVNPKIQDNAPELCGCGVAFMLVSALFGNAYAERFLDICAVSTIADLVPLVGSNRIIAHAGLKKLSHGPLRTGIKALLKVSGHKTGTSVSSGDIAFKLAPRLNASGRLSNAEKSLKLLISNDEKECAILADELEAENKKRQELCLETINDARKLLLDYDLVNNRIIVLESDSWEGGVIGIAAAKIAEEFQRPTILFARKEDTFKGSCRSIQGINIHEVLSNAEDAIIQFGGHQMAAGLSIEPQKMDYFITLCNNYIKDNFDDELFRLQYHSDANIDLNDVTLQFVNQLKKLEPFGMGNPRPTFSSTVKAMPFERIKRLNHVKCKVNAQCEIVAFNEFDKIETLRSGMTKTIYYNPDKESFMGRESVRCTYKNMVINEIIPSDNEILISVAERYALRKVNDAKKVEHKRNKSDKLFGKLLITWSKDNYVKLINKFPSYARALNRLTSINPYNTILLAPRDTRYFDYYSEIEVYDAPPTTYVEALKNSFSAEVRSYDNPLNVNLNVKLPSRDTLIKTYNAIYHLYKDKDVESVEDMFYKCSVYGYQYDYMEFIIGFNVLKELEIIYIINDKIKFSSEKKDLGTSKILKLREI